MEPDEPTQKSGEPPLPAQPPLPADQPAAPDEGEARTHFWLAPLHGPNPRPMSMVGDWVAASGIVLFFVSVCLLPWINVGVKDVFGVTELLGIKAPSASYGLFESPWAWAMLGVLVVMLLGMYFVQTRGALVLAAGVSCLIFNVVFFIGAWQKINAIIGNVTDIARSIPIIGQALGEAVEQLTKQFLSVHVAAGFWVLIPAAVLLIVGASLRMAAEPAEGGAPQ